MQNFRNLDVWQKSHDLALKIYRATASYPNAERFGLTSQMRRAVISIPANIAEGCGRASNTEFRQFLHIAAGSTNEIVCFLLLSRDLGLMPPAQALALERVAINVKQMLTRLIQTVDASRQPSIKVRIAPRRGPVATERASAADGKP